MRGLTTAIIAGAIVLVVVLGLLVRQEADDEPEMVTAPVRERPRQKKEVKRAARVEERLQRLRESNAARRQGGIERGPERQKAEMPVTLPTARPPVVAAESDDPEEVAELTDTIRNDPDPEERASAVFFLGGSSEQAAVPVLLDALNDQSPEVRLAAVEALGDYVEDISPDALVPALNDPDAEVRFEALGVIGDMEDPDVMTEWARRMLNDPDEDVRSLAEGILEMEEN